MTMTQFDSQTKTCCCHWRQNVKQKELFAHISDCKAISPELQLQRQGLMHTHTVNSVCVHKEY